MADQNRLREYLHQVERDHTVYLVGLYFGGRWAANSATIDDLDSLLTFKSHLDDSFEWELWFAPDPTIPFTAAERWHFAVIDPNGCGVRSRLPINPDRAAAAAFWSKYSGFGPGATSPDFVRGFSVGAITLFERFNASE